MDVVNLHAVQVTAARPMLLPLLLRQRGALPGHRPAAPMITQVVALMGEVVGVLRLWLLKL